MRGREGGGSGKEALLSDLPTCFTPTPPFLGEKSCEAEGAGGAKTKPWEQEG